MAGDPDAGDVIDAEAYSVAELRDMLFRNKGPLSPPLALALLGRKTYPRKVADMTRLLMDENAAPRLRVMAGQILGRAGSPAAVRALERGLEVKNELALRGVLEGLRQAGRAETPAMLARLKRRKGVVGRTAARAAGLLGHRFGLRGNALPEAEGLRELRVDPRRSQPIEVARAPGARVKAALAELSAALPGAKLVGTGALALRCAGRDLLLLFEAAAQAEAPDHFGQRKALVGVIAEKATLEGSSWSVKYQLLTEPQKDGTIRLLAASMRGVPVYAGTARIKGGRATFAWRTLDRPGAVAVDIQGAFEEGRIAVKQARSSARRRPALVPARAASPSAG